MFAFDLFIFCFVLTEKYKSIKAVEDDFYHKVIEGKCSENFKLKSGYTAEEKWVRRFCVDKNYCIKDINKINGKKEKKLVCTKYIFFYVFETCTVHCRCGGTDMFCAKAVVKTL